MGFDPAQNAVTVGGIVQNTTLKGVAKLTSYPQSLLSLTSFANVRMPVRNQDPRNINISQMP